jgi:hypothetical protein
VGAPGLKQTQSCAVLSVWPVPGGSELSEAGLTVSCHSYLPFPLQDWQPNTSVHRLSKVL